MTRLTDMAARYVASRETERLGLSIGHKPGRLDATTCYVLDGRSDHGPCMRDIWRPTIGGDRSS